MKPIILASQSPRRKEILEKSGYPFTIDVADIDESIQPNVPIEEEIQRLAFEKAKKVLERHPDAIVVGSDTVVVCDGEVLGKPNDKEDARRMLEALSDNTHQVITGLCVISSDEVEKRVSISDVHFQKMSPEEIEAYLQTEEPMDKAGAYAIQGYVGKFIDQIHGDYYAIMGLPLSLVYEILKQF